MANNHNNNGGIMNNEKRLAYWRANLRLVAACLAVWFVVSFGFGILLVEQLNSIRIGGFKLGFWFAQQGSIYAFILLILVNAIWMDRIDARATMNTEADAV